MIAVIVPCYNEESRLDISAFQAFIIQNEDYHFYFIDDGSTDETFRFLEQNLLDHSRLTVLRSIKNLGKGGAIRYVINNLPREKFKYLAFIDADLEIPLNQLIKLKKAIDLTPELLACLSIRNEIVLSLASPARRLGSSAIRKISSYLIGFKIPISDTQCGCKMFSVDVIEIFKDSFISSWLFDIEIILRLRDRFDITGGRIGQIELNNLNSVKSKKNYNARAVWKLLHQINKINRNYN